MPKHTKQATFSLSHCIESIRQALEFAEVETDFQPLRLWAYRLGQAYDAELTEQKELEKYAGLWRGKRQHDVRIWVTAVTDSTVFGVTVTDTHPRTISYIRETFEDFYCRVETV